MSRTELDRLEGGRLDWLDLLRGVSILLVLVWHATAIPALFEWHIPDWLRMANNALLPFRMPMLMFLSGLLLPRSLKKSRIQYYLGKVRTLVWPYVLWVAVYLSQYEVPWPVTSWRTWYASGYLWFLFFIAVYYFVAPLVVLLPRWLTPWLFLIASLPLASSIEKRLLYFGTFFFFGYWFATSPRLLGALRGLVLPIIGGFAVAWGVISYFYGADVAYRGEYSLFSICGILVATWLASRASGGWMRPLVFVGRHSVVYYVAHFPVMTTITLVLLEIEGAKSSYIPLINFVVAMAVVTALAFARKSPLISALFVMPATFSRMLQLPLVSMSEASERLRGRRKNSERPGSSGS